MFKSVEDVINFNLTLGDNQQGLTPVIVGNTGVGKTTQIRQLADKMEMKVKTLLLGTMLEEDVLGIPKADKGITKWTLPEYGASPEPFILFLDELDKARPSVLATVLTLMAEKRIRDHILPKGTIVIAAMQPVSPSEFLSDETGRAIVARSVFFKQHDDMSYLEEKYRVNLSFMPEARSFECPISPRPSPRQIEWCLSYIRSCVFDKEKDQMVRDVLAGVVPEQLIEPLIAACLNQDSVEPEHVVKAIVRDPSQLDKLSNAELINLIGSFYLHGTPELVYNVIKRMAESCDSETFIELTTAQFNQLSEAAIAEGGEIDVFGSGETEEELAEKAVWVDKIFTLIGETWASNAQKEHAEKNK